MLVTQAYKFALDPTPRQEGALASHCGAARYAFNWALTLVKRRLDERAAGLDVQVPWTLPALRREWNRVKQQVAPWWQENSKEAYNSGLGRPGTRTQELGRLQGRPTQRPQGRLPSGED